MDNKKDNKTVILEMYNNPVFKELQAYYSQPTIFGILGIERKENLHSAFLRWLLDAKSQHNLQNTAMRSLLSLYACSEGAFQGCEESEEGNLKEKLISGNYNLEIAEVSCEKSQRSIPGKRAKAKNRKSMDVWAQMQISWEKDERYPEFSKEIVLCIENKIYCGEGADQTKDYNDAITQYCKEKKAIGVEIYLTPNGSKAECENFVPTTYQKLLDGVIEPLLCHSLSADIRTYISDYVRILGRPCTDVENGMDKDYTILAISRSERDKLEKIYEMPIFKKILVAVLPPEVLQKEEYQLLYVMTEEEKNMLCDLWDANEELFKTVAYSKGILTGATNRDCSRYIVSFGLEDKISVVNLKNKAGNKYLKASKSECVFLVIKCWTKWFKKKNRRKPSLEEINKEFPLRKINKYYGDGKFFKNLVYKYEKGYDYKYDGTENGEVVGNWDFYRDEEHKFEIEGGDATTLKMWRKGDFDRFRSYIEEKHSEFNECLSIELA